jgi:hypothetical protein
MKEIQKKDLPAISGGQVGTTYVVDPTPVAPLPTYPQAPGGPIDPTDPIDPLGDRKQVNS